MRLPALLLILALAGCSTTSGLGMFVQGDLSNAAFLANANHDVPAAMCWGSLSGTFAPTPNPAADGLAVIVERKRLVQQSVGGPCGPVIAPMLLQALGKIAGPFGIPLPF